MGCHSFKPFGGAEASSATEICGTTCAAAHMQGTSTCPCAPPSGQSSVHHEHRATSSPALTLKESANEWPSSTSALAPELLLQACKGADLLHSVAQPAAQPPSHPDCNPKASLMLRMVWRWQVRLTCTHLPSYQVSQTAHTSHTYCQLKRDLPLPGSCLLRGQKKQNFCSMTS